MTTIRLEKFTDFHCAHVSARLVSDAEIEIIRNEAFESGIREGAAAATEAFSSEQSRCLSRIQEVIADTFFAREEAHRLALSSLRPLIEALSEAIAPELCKHGLSAEIAKIAQEAARRAPDDTLTVFVASDAVEEVSAMLRRSNPAVVVLEDFGLKSSEARVCWNEGFNRIDLNAATTAAMAAIDGFFCELAPSENMKVQNAN